MRIRRQHVFEGPSLHALVPVVYLTLDPGGLDVLAEDEKATEVAARIEALLPEDASLFGNGKGARPERSLAGCVASLALALQREYGFQTFFQAILGRDRAGRVDLVFAYGDPGLGSQVGRLATDLVSKAAAEDPGLEDPSDDLRKSFQLGLEHLGEITLKVNTRRFVWEAERRGIPWHRIPQSYGIVQFGQGCRQQRLDGGYLQTTDYLATRLAGSKLAAAEVFRRHGLPVPDHVLVFTFDEAKAAAERLGYPVVVKPDARGMGKGVSIDVGDAEQLRRAFEDAHSYGAVLIEQQVAGFNHRITVLNGKLLGASRYIAAHVIGDGRASIQTLVDRINRDPRRSARDFSPLRKIVVDETMRRLLTRQGHDLQSVPAAGERVALREWWRQGVDHSGEDFTDTIHPANQDLAERAARLVGLDLAGVDLISPDITKPWDEVGGVINEINPNPSLSAHVRVGTPAVHRIILETVYPPGEDGRIPLATILKATKSTAATRLLANLLRSLGHCVGLANSEGVVIGDQTALQRDAAQILGARMVLGDPKTTAAVVELSDHAVAEQGLCYDRATAAAVMEMPGSVAAAKLLLDCADNAAVVDADRPELEGLADRLDPARRFLLAEDAERGRVKDHIAGGGRAVSLDRREGTDWICLWDKGARHAISALQDVGRGLGPERSLNDKAIMLAVAMAYALGLSIQQIADGLKSG